MGTSSNLRRPHQAVKGYLGGPALVSHAADGFANGQRALEKGSYDAAIGWLSGAIEREPKNAAAYRMRAKAHYLMAGSKVSRRRGCGGKKQ